MIKKLLLACLAALFIAGFMEGLARCVLYQRNGRYSFALAQWSSDFKARMAQPRSRSRSINQDLDEWSTYLHSPGEIKRLIPSFLAQHVAFGNTPFNELKKDKTTSVYRDSNGHLCNKPGAAYDLYFMRSRLYNPFDPIVYKANAGEEPTGDVLAFRERYTLMPKRNTIDANGDRITVPPSTSTNLVLVIGDSVAFGAGLGDEETLSSQLQTLHPEWRFVNVGVSGCNARDNLERLDQRLKLFGSQVKGVIYVHCENDYDAPRGDDPQWIVSQLARRLDAASITNRVLVYQMFVYRTLPDLFRERPVSETRQYYQLKHEMLTEARRHGIETIDFYAIVDRYRKAQGSPLAGVNLYVDHCHFSVLGTRLVAESIPGLGTPVK